MMALCDLSSDIIMIIATQVCADTALSLASVHSVMPHLMRYPVLRPFFGLWIKSAMTWLSYVVPRLI
jgi:hypothetical protein